MWSQYHHYLHDLTTRTTKRNETSRRFDQWLLQFARTDFLLSDASEGPSNIYDPRDMQARALTCHHIDSHKQLNERCCEGQPQP